jgi:hypothetical protein
LWKVKVYFVHSIFGDKQQEVKLCGET